MLGYCKSTHNVQRLVISGTYSTYSIHIHNYEQLRNSDSYIPEWVLDFSVIEEVYGNHDNDADKEEHKREK